MSVDARRYTSKRSRERLVMGAPAIIGASMAVQATSLLLINVARLDGKPPNSVRFFDTDQEAIDWLAVQREQDRSKQRQSVSRVLSAG